MFAISVLVHSSGYCLSRINHGSDNMTRNISDLLPSDLPSDIDDKMKMRIAREGLELLHNGTGNMLELLL